MGNFIKGRAFVVFSNDGFIEIPKGEVNVEGAIWLTCVGEGWDPFGWPGHRGDDLKVR